MCGIKKSQVVPGMAIPRSCPVGDGVEGDRCGLGT